MLAAMPVFVFFFLLVRRHYAAVDRQLSAGRVRFGDVGVNHTVLVLTDFDAAAAEALGYIRSLRPEWFEVLYVGDLPQEDAEMRWGDMAPGAPPLIVPASRDPVDSVLGHIRRIERGPDDFVTVVIPELFRG